MIYQTPYGRYTPHPVTRKAARRKKTKRYDSCKLCVTCIERGGATTYARFTANGECIHCRRLAAIDAYNAAPDLKGEDFYWVPEMCAKAGHVGKRTLAHECYECVNTYQTPSPRQQAITAGERWYTPSEPCKKGHMAEVRVADGACKQCIVKPSALPTIQDSQPYLIIDRETARAVGFNVYRTGAECKRGHRSYRYLSTGGCITCKKLK